MSKNEIAMNCAFLQIYNENIAWKKMIALKKVKFLSRILSLHLVDARISENQNI